MVNLVKIGPRLYAPSQVAVASLLGSPVAGAFLLGLNERSLGRPRRALWAAGGGLVGTAVLVGVGALLPAAAARGLGIGSIVAMHRIAAMARDARDGHGSENPGSWWIVAALGAACFVAIVGAAVALSLAAGWVPRD